MAAREADALEIVRGGLRFADPDVERAFRTWYIGQAVPFTRIGMVASLMAWVTTWLVLAAIVPGAGRDIAPWVLGLIVLIAAAMLMTYKDDPGPWMLRLTALANSLAGLVLVGPILSGLVPEHLTAAVGAVTVSFFAFTIFRLHPLQAAAAVATYALLYQVVLIRSYQLSEISASQFARYSVAPLVAYSTGLLVCAIFSRMSREAYKRELLIEAQREEIAHEHERAERLLLNILPAPIAERLKVSNEAIADHLENVTVLFADIVGFTPLAARLPPGEVVGVLNTIFTAFDALAERHGAETIKTIGDAYMAVTGLPFARDDHAVVAADLALDIRAEAVRLSADTGHDIAFRIGLCSGSAVAGVIGRRKFAYDLWGDTVNMAARMESQGVSGEIQVTRTTHDLLLDAGFVLEPRGSVDIKGRGHTQTWLLRGRHVV